MLFCFFFFFKQKTAYEMRISDWSSDVCSSDLLGAADHLAHRIGQPRHGLDADSKRLEPGGIEQQAIEQGIAQPALAARIEIARIRGKDRFGVQIGRASCREQVCPYVWISVVALSLKTK